jgi:hypothetical protein
MASSTNSPPNKARNCARDDLATARILVKGKYRKPAANAPKDPAGAPIPTLDVTAFLPLGVAAAE